MRAAVLRQGEIVVDDVPDLRPGPRQVLVSTIACGICGSDLHARNHAHELAATAQEADVPTFVFDPDADLVLGHEMSVEVMETGTEVEGVAPGTAMTAMPMLTTTEGHSVTPGYENDYPGGYSEQMLLDPDALLPIPNGLDPAIAALTEPMAVGLHAVNQSAAEQGRGAIVVGAGPVGLAVIAALSVLGAEPIVATDFSPTRRQLAQNLGAHVVLDPAGLDRQAGFDAAVDACRQGAASKKAPIIYEGVGTPGMIDTVMTGAPPNSEILVVGMCMQPDHFRPVMGIYKRLTLRFVLGWRPKEFAQSMHNLAEGMIDGSLLITGQVPLDDVPASFNALADPDTHIKILVRPNGLS